MSASAAPQPLPTYVTLVSGATAGVVELMCLYPLDVVKTRLQLQRSSAGGAAPYRGVIHTLGRIARDEGPGALYRGIGPLLLLEAPKRAIKFGANDFWGKVFRPLFPGRGTNATHALLTGCTAGATESLVVVPFELVKIRLQDRAQTHLYRGPMDVVRKIVAESGWAGLFRGLPATMVRHILWNGGYFGSIPLIRSYLRPPTNKRERMQNMLFSGTLGGFIGTVLNTPADVVKTRIQNTSAGPGQQKYRGIVHGFARILREEGPAALYKGFLPKVVRLAPGGGLLLFVVESINSQVRHLLGPPYI
ncbi:hypothetical protein MCAP1_000400 [Malassezia caprae]|uniref:Mitochondrial carrier n=1 Tax=Malassezia caprae TaxID=1381934 RepID=A0AAF0ITZ4_9BASI|nr:hypothetical protein MCAP1_000400 [Malassezia caprae]